MRLRPVDGSIEEGRGLGPSGRGRLAAPRAARRPAGMLASQCGQRRDFLRSAAIHLAGQADDVGRVEVPVPLPRLRIGLPVMRRPRASWLIDETLVAQHLVFALAGSPLHDRGCAAARSPGQETALLLRESPGATRASRPPRPSVNSLIRSFRRGRARPGLSVFEEAPSVADEESDGCGPAGHDQAAAAAPRTSSEPQTGQAADPEKTWPCRSHVVHVLRPWRAALCPSWS